MYDLNILDVLGQRKVRISPPHFQKIDLGDASYFIAEIETWVRTRLKGRYFLKKMPCLSSDGKLKPSACLGFEDHKELTYFMLANPHLRRK